MAMQAVGFDGPLHITSRLDHCTEGLLMLAKSSAFAALYNHLQRSVTNEGGPCVAKTYLALTKQPPPLGKQFVFALEVCCIFCVLTGNGKVKGGGGESCVLDIRTTMNLNCSLRQQERVCFTESRSCKALRVELSSLTDTASIIEFVLTPLPWVHNTNPRTQPTHHPRFAIEHNHVHPGLLTHYLLVNQKIPGEVPGTTQPLHTRVFDGEHGAAKLSQLVVAETRRVALGGSAAAQWGPEGYESTIELKTGRTHQVR